jgi:hypothetical protein
MCERRIENRTALEVAVWLEGPSKNLLPCCLTNMSLRGCELIILPEIILPKQFPLLLTSDSKIKRGCDVIWRRGDRVGVRFFPWPDNEH